MADAHPVTNRFTIRLRLEDVVALVFFLLTLAIRIVFRELREENVSPADVLIIIPAVSLLLAKELVHYFVAGRELKAETVEAAGPRARGDLKEFVRPYWEIVRDWFPFLVVLLMYYSLWGDATHLLTTTDRDAALIAWDQRLFGFQASVALQRFIGPALTGWMEFAYVYHIWNIPLVACFLYLWRPRERFREMMCGVLVVSFFGLLGYLLVPAIGPMYTLRNQYTVPLNQPLDVFNREVEFMNFARIRRDVFPSLHVGISFVVWLYAWRNSRRLGWILTPLILSLWVSTVYLRYHYLVDCLAGLVLAPLCYWLANWMFKRFGTVRVPVTLPSRWARGAVPPSGAIGAEARPSGTEGKERP
jgi:membrane-associated phospholipid phosphatase